MEINAKHNQIHNPRLVLQGETERKCGNAKKKFKGSSLFDPTIKW